MSRRDVLRTAFSKPAEVHAFVHGLYRALVTLNPKPTEPDSLDELAYWRAGYLAGKAFQATVLFVVANTGLKLGAI